MSRIAKSAIKKKTWLLVAHARNYIIRRPQLRKIVSAVFAHYPGLEKRMKQGANAATAAQSDQFHGAYELAYPTTHAKKIHADLKAAVEHRRKKRV